MTVREPAARYPGARFVLRRPTATARPSVWLENQTKAHRVNPIATLDQVISIDIVSQTADAGIGGVGRVPTLLTVTVDGRSTTLPWTDVAKTPRVRPQGIKKGGHRLRDIVGRSADLARVLRVELDSGNAAITISGAQLRATRYVGLLRRNRRGLIRFHHYERHRGGGDGGGYRVIRDLRAIKKLTIVTSTPGNEH